MKTVIIYMDGACSGNPGPGGWAAIILDGDREEVLSGGGEQEVCECLKREERKNTKE